MKRWNIKISRLGKLKDLEIKVNKFMVFVGNNNLGKSYLLMLLWYIIDTSNRGYYVSQKIVDTFGDKGRQYIYQFSNKQEIYIRANEINYILDLYINNYFHPNQVKRDLFNNQEIEFSNLSISLEKYRENFRFIYKQNYDSNTVVVNRKGPNIFEYSIPLENSNNINGEDLRATGGVLVLINICRLLFGDFIGFNSANNQIQFLPPSRSSYLNTYKILSDYSLKNSFRYSDSRYSNDRESNLMTRSVVSFLRTLNNPINVFSEKHNNYLTNYENDILEGSLKYDEIEKKYFYFTDNLTLPVRNISSLVSEFGPVINSIRQFPTKFFNTLIVEEPEAHLHPELQMKIVDLFTDFYRQNNCVWLTTHSDYLIHSINNKIKENQINSNMGIFIDEINCYTFKKWGNNVLVKNAPKSRYGIQVDTFNEFIREIRRRTFDLDKKLKERYNEDVITRQG